MINYILHEPVFLDLFDNEGQIVGKTPQQIIKHLQENFCDDEETEEEILKKYKKINVNYEPANMVQVCSKALKYARTILMSLQETVTDKFLVFQAIDQFNKHMDLNEAVDDWKKIAPQKKWKKFKMHFTKAVMKNQKRSSTLREIGIANQVKEQVETNRENTETMEIFQINLAQTIEELTARLDQLVNTKAPTGQAYGAQVPSVIMPPSRSDDMSQITTILQAVLEAQAKTPGGRTYGNVDSSKTKRKWNKNDNDMPNSQRSKLRHPKINSY